MATTEGAIAQGWRRAGLSFLGLALLCLALFFPTWKAMAITWWHTTAFNHGMVVLPISAFLVWQRRSALMQMAPATDPWGLLLLAGFAALWLLGEAAQVMLVQHVAVVGLLIGLFVALFGRPIARFLWFPLLFLFFMVPAGNFLIPHLQTFAAGFVTLALRMVDVPVFREGTMLMTPSGLFEVAEACAGLRFIMANFVVTTLFAYWAYDRAYKWIALLIISFVVPVLANGVRAFAIVYIAYLTDNEYGTGFDHIVYGWGIFVLTMFLILLIGSWFADRPIGWFPDQPPLQRRSVRSRGWRPALALAGAALLMAGPAYARTVMVLPPAPAQPQAPVFKASIGWSASEGVSDWQPRILNPDLVVHRTYAQAGRTVDFFVAYFAFERPGAEAVSQRHRLHDGESWTRVARGSEALRVEGVPTSVHREDLASPSRDARRLVLWWYWIGGEATSSAWQAKLLQVRDRLLGRAEPAAIIALSAPYETSPETALQAIRSFLQDGLPPAGYLAALAGPD